MSTVSRLGTIFLLLLAATAASNGSNATASSHSDSCCLGGAGGSATGGDGGNVSAWVSGAPGGGVQPPGGGSASQCTPWVAAANTSGEVEQGGSSTIRVDPDGVVAVLHVRDCGSPPVRQYVWIREETPESLAEAALGDISSRLLTPPDVVLSPPTRSVVNLETWLAVTDPGTISATASVPGLSSTTSASVASTTFDLGNGDRVTCPNTGVAWTEADGTRPAPCGYTYRRADAPGHVTQVSVTMSWTVTWSSSDGSSGTLPSVISAAAVIDHPVNEIQTIGTDG